MVDLAQEHIGWLAAWQTPKQLWHLGSVFRVLEGAKVPQEAVGFLAGHGRCCGNTGRVTCEMDLVTETPQTLGPCVLHAPPGCGWVA